MAKRFVSIVAGFVMIAVLGGCVSTFLEIRRDMMATSLLYCTSQYNAKVGDRVDFQVGLEGTTFTYGSDVQKYWNGIISDKEFREYLREEGINVIEFQATVSTCQRDWLERDGYFDIIRPG